MSGQEAISVLVARGDDSARDELVTLLTGTGSIQVVGVAGDVDTVVALARQTRPDIVLVDLDLPASAGGAPALDRGIAVTEVISSTLPATGLILLSAQMDAAVLQRAMMAGAREFLRMPAEPAEVLHSIQRLHVAMAPRRALIQGVRPAALDVAGLPAGPRPRGQVIAVYAPKGGAGRTTLATNLAVAIRQGRRMNVALVDASLPFGDVGVLLDLPPTHSIADLQVPDSDFDADYVDSVLLPHKSGIKALLAPPRPEMSEMVTDELLRRTLRVLRERYDYVVVDTSPTLDDRVLTTLEEADTVLLALPPTLSAIRSAKAFLEVTTLLQFPPDKVMPIVTRVTAAVDIAISDVETTLGRPVEARIPADERGVTHAINVGDPIVLSAADSPVAVAIGELARHIVAKTHPEPAVDALAVPAGPPRLRQFKLFRSS